VKFSGDLDIEALYRADDGRFPINSLVGIQFGLAGYPHCRLFSDQGTRQFFISVH
jgi:hypothetical protein